MTEVPQHEKAEQIIALGLALAEDWSWRGDHSEAASVHRDTWEVLKLKWGGWPIELCGRRDEYTLPCQHTMRLLFQSLESTKALADGLHPIELAWAIDVAGQRLVWEKHPKTRGTKPPRPAVIRHNEGHYEVGHYQGYLDNQKSALARIQDESHRADEDRRRSALADRVAKAVRAGYIKQAHDILSASLSTTPEQSVPPAAPATHASPPEPASHTAE